MHKFIKSAIAASILAAAGASSVDAATATTTFNVTATVLARCLATANTLAFGNYDPGVAAIDQTSTISVRCTRGTNFSVGLNAGLTSGATVTTRRMRSAANTADELSYTLFTDAARTTNWDNTGGTGVVTGTGNGIAPASAVALTVYGRIPDTAANQNAAVAADYADTITVTVTY
jgi:spore coat protein U-like protein